MKIRRRKGYLFTSKKQSWNGLISTSLGLISLVSSALMIWQAYQDGGQSSTRAGAVVLLCLLFSMAGMIIAILSRREPDRFYLFSYLGMILNGIVLVLCFIIMYLGVV